MPWKESSAMEQRTKFVFEVKRGEDSFAELCRRYGISRETGYKWMKRYEAGGVEALKDASHVAHQRPHAMSEQVRQAVIEMRRKHPGWGPGKLKARLERDQQALPEQDRMSIPAASSLGDLLRREGLTHRRRRGPGRASAATEPLSHAAEPNDVWSIDYKGWFHTGDGNRCDPLTLTDNASRYLLRLTAMPEICQGRVRAVMDAAFREYGVPKAIRSDNGSPFATTAPGGLSRLAIWWLRLGIRLERIEPGHPEQNGRHERFHWTLVKECLDYSIAWDCRLQQKVFVAYRQEFNHLRPHEALGMNTPAEVYRPSVRPYPVHVPEMRYDASFHVRRVDGQGRYLWNGQRVPLSPVLTGEPVGLRECEDGLFEVWYGPVFLGWMDAAELLFVREDTAQAWARRHACSAEAVAQPCSPPGASPLRPQDLPL